MSIILTLCCHNGELFQSKVWWTLCMCYRWCRWWRNRSLVLSRSSLTLWISLKVVCKIWATLRSSNCANLRGWTRRISNPGPSCESLETLQLFETLISHNQTHSVLVHVHCTCVPLMIENKPLNAISSEIAMAMKITLVHNSLNYEETPLNKLPIALQ